MNIDWLIEQGLKNASESGAKAGRNSAEWIAQDLFGGRNTRPLSCELSAHAVISGEYEANYPNLSGEWEGDLTPQGLMEELFTSEELDLKEIEEMEDEICTRWEDAAINAQDEKLSELAQAYIESLTDENS